jgi:hypothetical protein
MPRGPGVRAVRSELGLELSVPGSPSPVVFQQPKPKSVPSSLDLENLPACREEEGEEAVPDMLPVAIPSQISMVLSVAPDKTTIMDAVGDAPAI